MENSPPRLLKRSFVLRCREAGRQGEAKLSALFDLMQEIASNHAELLGFGFRALRETNFGWALSRIRLEMDLLPRLGEEVTLTTYPAGIHRIFALREYRFELGGREIGRATGAWLALDMTKLRVVRPELLPGRFPDNRDLARSFDLAEKLPPPVGEPLFEVPVRYSMEDVNGHLNNAEYAGFVEDAAALLLGRAPRLTEVEMDFLSACHAPENLTIRAGLTGETQYAVSGFHADGSPAFNALCREG